MNTSHTNTKNNSELRTANIIGVGVNAVSLATFVALFTAFSFSEKKYSRRTNLTFKLPTFLFGSVLFLTAVAKKIAVLFATVLIMALQLINAILEIAPRGILFLLSVVNFIFSHLTLSSAEWLTKAQDEEDSAFFGSNDLPLISPYVQHES